MACILTPSLKATVDFQGPTGSKFTIKATTTNSLIGITLAMYGPDGNHTTILAGQPFTFTILHGVNTLTVIGLGTVPNVPFQIVETCPPAPDNVLHSDVLSASGHFNVGIEIEGV